MSAQRRTQIIVVGGALAIASAAYGLGTQAGGGTAVADNNQDNERGARVMLARGPCGPSALADDLGVDESKLEAALRDFREEHANGMRSDFAKELEGYSTSTGTIRFTPDKPLPAALVTKIVKARIAENKADAKERAAIKKGRGR